MSEVLRLKCHLDSLSSSEEKRSMTKENKALFCNNIKCRKQYWSVDVKQLPSTLSSKDITANRIYCNDCENHDDESRENFNITIRIMIIITIMIIIITIVIIITARIMMMKAEKLLILQ